MMKRILLALAASAIAFPAFAADAVEQDPVPMAELPVVATWTGGYVGLQAGYGFGSTGTVAIDPFTFAGLVTAFTPAGAAAGSSFNANGDFDDGFVGGAHVGYDWQVGNFVLGGILDINFTDLGDKQRAFSRTPATYEIERELDYLATLRARLGYAFNDRFMAYATGGLAYGDVDFSYRQPGSGATFTTEGGQDSDIGYTVGGGVEARVTQRVSIGLEYLYTDLGDNDFRANLQGGPFGGAGGAPGSNAGGTTLTGSDSSFDFHTVTLKFSYRF